MGASFDRLRHFITTRMRMSHIYQPVMLKVLIERGGQASAREIGATFLAHDESQLDYYEEITNRMPGPVLRRHDLVTRQDTGYALAPDVADLSPEERQGLISLCDDSIAAFKAKRGMAIWEHRAVGLGQIPGRPRYETLKRAGFRCELCGISPTERALGVDHIHPRKHGGQDTPENFQALCWLCNTNKGAGDDADFRGVNAQYANREPGCVFCELPQERIVGENSSVSQARHRE